MASDKGITDNPLHISWHDSAWIPVLNRSNVLKYFSERSNSFYDSTCNNEIIKMQNLSLDHLSNMTGMEYVLLHSQDPILHIVRKQMRHSPVQVTSIADYYIIAGIVYQAPDVKSVINSRLTSALHHIDSAFSEAISYSRYHPSKGYWWQFNEDGATDSKKKSTRKRKKKKEDPGSMFQCRRVDQLLSNLITKFPHKFYQLPSVDKPVALQAASKQNANSNPEVKTEGVRQENQVQMQTKMISGNVQSGNVSNANSLQARVKTEPSDAKPPAEKRTKFV